MIPYCKPELELTIEDFEEVKEIVDSGQFCLGKHTDLLSQYFKDTCKVEYAIPCCNATNGLVITLRAAGLVDKYIAVPAFTWPSTIYAIECNRNSSIFIDIKKDTWTIDNSKIPPMAQAVIAVDTFGVNSYLDTKLPVVYDAAHGFGVQNLGRRGIAEVVSFSFTKKATAMQGGIILTNKKHIAEKAEELVKLSAKITEINAYMFFKSLETYRDRMNDSNKAINNYRNYIKVTYEEQYLTPGIDWNYSVYGILLENKNKRDRCYNNLKEAGFETKIYYEPIYKDKYLEVTNYVFDRILCLPVSKHIFPYIEQIAKVINNS